jgi:hypothetical protein
MCGIVFICGTCKEVIIMEGLNKQGKALKGATETHYNDSHPQIFDLATLLPMSWPAPGHSEKNPAAADSSKMATIDSAYDCDFMLAHAALIEKTARSSTTGQRAE